MKKVFILSIIISLLCLTACSEEKGKEELTPITNKDNSITTFGVIKCQNTKDIVVPFNTSIKKILIGKGEEIGMGESLIEFDLTEYNLETDKKREEIDTHKQQLQNLELKFKTLQNKIEIKKDNLNITLTYLNKKLEIINNYMTKGLSPENRKLALTLETAKNDLDLEKSNLSDSKLLYNAGAASLKEYQEEQRNVKAREQKIEEIKLDIAALKQKYKADAETIEASINQNRSELTNLETDSSYELNEVKASIRQSKKLLSSVEAELQQLIDSIDNASIKNGSLLCNMKRAALESIRYNPGDTIAAGSIIAKVMDLDSLYIEVDIEEQSISQVLMDSKAQIIPEMYKTKFYTGRVTFISSVAEQKNNETMITIRISIDNPDEFLIPNANVKVKILTDQV